MSWINGYMSAVYEDGGRGPNAFDCWGLVRDVLHKYFDVPELLSYGCVCPDDKRSMNAGYKVVKTGFKACCAVPGAVACGYRSGCLVHVGVVVETASGLRVLHASRASGVSLVSLREFERLFLKVGFYCYGGSS